ncbi:uncharacterized protein LOC144763964 [Lissotriton helveticus]
MAVPTATVAEMLNKASIEPPTDRELSVAPLSQPTLTKLQDISRSYHFNLPKAVISSCHFKENDAESRNLHQLSANCPAINQQCGQSGKMGHFAKICMRGRRGSVRGNVRCVINDDSVNDDGDNCSNEGDLSHEDIMHQEYVVVVKDSNNIEDSQHISDPEVDVIIEKNHVQLLVDTGVTIKGKVYVARRGINVLGLIHQAEIGLTIKPGLANPVFIDKQFKQDVSVTSVTNSTSRTHIDSDWEQKFSTIFEDRLGKITNFQHSIRVKDNVVPTKHKLRTVPLSIRSDLSKHLQTLCDQGIIEKVESTLWLSPIVLAKKRSGDLRMCVDLRTLNEAIWVDGFPLPRIEDLIAKVGSSSWFTKLDLKAAYHQVELHPQSRHLTAFVTPDGVFQFCLLPFGLASAAAVFQRLMSEMFAHNPNKVVFQDDILIFTKTKNEHNRAISEVFKVLENTGVTLQKSKCVFKAKEIEYLGHVISEKGIKPRPGLVKSIIKASAPQNREQLMSFLGLCEFYAKFMKDYAKTTECFRSLLKKGAVFVWSEECKKGFQVIKDHILSAPALQAFVEGRQTFVTVDACEYGLGAVLSQYFGGKEYTVGFASRTRRPVERKYSVIEKELLACTWSVEKFKSYLWGRSFILKTDHRPLVDILNGKNVKRTTARLARLSTKLLEYTFSVEYIPGGRNSRADCLSRLPIPDNDEQDWETEVEQCFVANVCQESILFLEDDWIKKLDNDIVLKEVSSLIRKGWPKEKCLSPDLQMFWKINTELSIENGIIVRGDKLVPPSCYREKIILAAHSGHLGATITKRKVRSDFWWPKMDSQVDELVKQCPRCNTSDKVLVLEGLVESKVSVPKNMLAIGQLKQFGEPNPAFRVLKPWWDVLAEYTNLIMAMLSIFTASLQVNFHQKAKLWRTIAWKLHSVGVTRRHSAHYREQWQDLRGWTRKIERVQLGLHLQISYEKLYCVAVPPWLSIPENTWNITHLEHIKNTIGSRGFKTSLDIQYFALINTWCTDNYIRPFTKFFPYLILINSLVILASSNFWFKFPGTSSKIEHFLSVLGKCLNSPWTAKALSATMYEDIPQSTIRLAMSKNPKAGMPSIYAMENEGKGSPTGGLQGSSSADKLQMALRTSPVDSKVQSKPEKILDKKEGEQAKALFEHVKKFRIHTEERDILYQMYKRQTFLRVFESIVFIVYICVFVPQMKHVSHCIDEFNMTGFVNHFCVYGMARMNNLMSTVYLFLLAVYTCLCFVNFYWIFHSNLKEYSFEKIRKESGIDDIPDVINDFAFLLHLIDQYDRLYSREFAVFLSDVSETKLLQMNLNNYWTIDKLKQSLSIDAQGKTELHLYMMPGIPSQVYELDEIEVLKLESVDMTIPSSISKLKDLNELWLNNCNIKLNNQALAFLKKNLLVLKISFSSPQEMPSWLYHMGKLQWLYLHGKLQGERGSINLHSFRELKQLQFLYLKLSMGSIPSPILELAATVNTLLIHNEGHKLFSLASLKALKKLNYLGLIQCKLDKIPNFIFSLPDLEGIDLEDNSLKSLEELVSLQHFKKVTSLKFSRNRITSIPHHIGQISNIESLYLNNNLITILNTAVCNLKKLSNLDISFNSIQQLPREIGQLQELKYLVASNNNIAMLPDELFTCINLEKLIVSHNKLTRLSHLVGNLTQLRYLELTGNLIETLPQELEKCVHLTKAGLQVEKDIYATLPIYVRKQLQAGSGEEVSHHDLEEDTADD